MFRGSNVNVDVYDAGLESLDQVREEGLAQGGIPVHRFGLALIAVLGACGWWTTWSGSPAPEIAVTLPAVVETQDQLSFEERFALPLSAEAASPALAFSERFASAFPVGTSSTEISSPQEPASSQGIEPVKGAAEPQPRQAVVPVPMARPAKAAVRLRKELPVSVASTWRPEPAKEEPSIFERLFGKVKPASMMAYASADPASEIDGKPAAALYDRQTAVYDITAKTVYLPSGKKLEAHSGLGSSMDNPSSEKLRMRGVTPPHAYDLTLRESMFHGVQAIRLNPVGGEDKIHGRVGLLAHSYMLGGDGASNGCVSIKDYGAFLEAFQSGEIKRLVVVAKLS